MTLRRQSSPLQAAFYSLCDRSDDKTWQRSGDVCLCIYDLKGCQSQGLKYGIPIQASLSRNSCSVLRQLAQVGFVDAFVLRNVMKRQTAALLAYCDRLDEQDAEIAKLLGTGQISPPTPDQASEGIFYRFSFFFRCSAASHHLHPSCMCWNDTMS